MTGIAMGQRVSEREWFVGCDGVGRRRDRESRDDLVQPAGLRLVVMAPTSTYGNKVGEGALHRRQYTGRHRLPNAARLTGSETWKEHADKSERMLLFGQSETRSKTT